MGASSTEPRRTGVVVPAPDATAPTLCALLMEGDDAHGDSAVWELLVRASEAGGVCSVGGLLSPLRLVAVPPALVLCPSWEEEAIELALRRPGFDVSLLKTRLDDATDEPRPGGSAGSCVGLAPLPELPAEPKGHADVCAAKAAMLSAPFALRTRETTLPCDTPRGCGAACPRPLRPEIALPLAARWL